MLATAAPLALAYAGVAPVAPVRAAAPSMMAARKRYVAPKAKKAKAPVRAAPFPAAALTHPFSPIRFCYQ